MCKMGAEHPVFFNRDASAGDSPGTPESSLSQPLAKGQEEIEHWRERAGWDAPTDGPVHGCAGEGGLAADDGPQDVDQLTVEIVEI